MRTLPTRHFGHGGTMDRPFMAFFLPGLLRSLESSRLGRTRSSVQRTILDRIERLLPKSTPMSPISLADFIGIVDQYPLDDVFVGIESLTNHSAGPWGPMEGGPVALCFRDTCVVLKQPIGRVHIEFFAAATETWLASFETDVNQIAAMRIFATACYRKDLDDSPPWINAITEFDAMPRNALGGLLLSLSTGGILGLDASSYGGLVWFLDNQTSIFRRECMEALPLGERVVWER